MKNTMKLSNSFLSINAKGRAVVAKGKDGGSNFTNS